MIDTKACSADSATSLLCEYSILRREPTEQDIQIEILFCGICYSDFHYARNEWNRLMETVCPCLPGHEIVGRVITGSVRRLQSTKSAIWLTSGSL